MTPLEVSGYALAVFTVLAMIGILVEPSSSIPLGLLSTHLHRAFSTTASLTSHLLPRRLTALCTRLSTRLFYRPTRAFQALYLALLFGCYALFLVYALPFLPRAVAWHRYVHPVVVAAAFGSFVGACRRPTYLSVSNAASALRCYPPHAQLYSADLACPTCRLTKPPRSKHCAVCGRCVLRFDHHCVWVNACVGEGNQRWFVTFLVVHVAFLVYGSWLLWRILYGALFESAISSRLPHSWTFYVQYVSFYHHVPVGLLFLASSLSLMLGAFASYHLYLVCTNQTTNERHKYGDIRAGRDPLLHWRCLPLIEREKAAQSKLRAVQAELLALDPSLAAQHSQWSTTLLTTPPATAAAAAQLGEAERVARCRALFERQRALVEEIEVCRAEVDARQDEEDGRLARGEGRVRSVHNPYNRGVLSNLREVFFPAPHEQSMVVQTKVETKREEQHGEEPIVDTFAASVSKAEIGEQKEQRVTDVGATTKRRKKKK